MLLSSRMMLSGAAALATVGAGVLISSAGPDASEPEPIPDAMCLRKMALDLSHRGPTEQELEQLAAGASMSEMAEHYMSSPEFEQVVFNWFRQKFPPTEVSPRGVDFEEPARIATHIVVNDMDYRLVLTGDFTVTAANEVQPRTDRPPAGVLATQHYMSAFAGSFRRNWAGHFLKEWSGIQLSAVALPPDEERDLSPESLLSDPACMGCHGDPVYGIDHLAGFAACWNDDGDPTSDCAGAAGSFLTKSGDGLPELGQIVADSNEFVSTTFNLLLDQLYGRRVAVQEAPFYARGATRFKDSGYRLKALIEYLVTVRHYCEQ